MTSWKFEDYSGTYTITKEMLELEKWSLGVGFKGSIELDLVSTRWNLTPNEYHNLGCHGWHGPCDRSVIYEPEQIIVLIKSKTIAPWTDMNPLIKGTTCSKSGLHLGDCYSHPEKVRPSNQKKCIDKFIFATTDAFNHYQTIKSLVSLDQYFRNNRDDASASKFHPHLIVEKEAHDPELHLLDVLYLKEAEPVETGIYLTSISLLATDLAKNMPLVQMFILSNCNVNEKSRNAFQNQVSRSLGDAATE